MKISGNLNIKGDKSISHRAAILGSMLSEESSFDNFASAEDCNTTLKVLKALGATYYFDELGKLHISGPLKKSSQIADDLILDAGNSGTTMRLLTGFLSGKNIAATITGDISLMNRPMQRIRDPLEKMGANIHLSESGTGPVKIDRNRGLHGIKYTLPIGSAQIKSAILMAGLFASGNTIVIDPFNTRDHTERMLDLHQHDHSITVNEDIHWKKGHYFIPGDISSAMFFIVLALVTEESQLIIQNVSLNGGRISAINAMIAMGANIQMDQKGISMNEPYGDIRITASRIEGGTIENDLIPSLIDEIPILSVLALHSQNGITFKGVQELRYKESDRVKSIVSNLKSMGAQIVDSNDSFKVFPLAKKEFSGTDIFSHSDHRIAMSMYIAGLSYDRELKIDDPASIAVSFPEFFQSINSLKGS